MKLETPDTYRFFHSGNKEDDIACMLDMAIVLVELWDVKNSPYNQLLKRCWLKRAKELEAKHSL